MKIGDKKVLSEVEMRTKLMNYAKNLGCDQELKMIYEKYYRLLRNCKNEQERQAIGAMGVEEVHKFLDMKGELVVDGKLILPSKEEKKG